MLNSKAPVIVSAARVPQARQNGALFPATPGELATLVARAAVCRSGIPPESVGSVFWGVMYQIEGECVYLPRHAALSAGLPATAPALLVNRLCGSGLDALLQGVRSILLGEAQIVLAGSTDTISRSANLVLSKKRELRDLTSGDQVSASIFDRWCGKTVAHLADDYARENEITRTELDRFAFESRARAAAAKRHAASQSQLVPVPATMVNPSGCGKPLENDQIESRWPTLEALASLTSPFGEGGRVTRGNSSAFADGASAFVLTSEDVAIDLGSRVMARIRSWAVSGACPSKPGDALVKAIVAAAAGAGIALTDVDWFEIEEAFAVYCVHAIRVLSLPTEKVNPLGGALAFGHAPATSGLRLIFSAMQALATGSIGFALAALCLGGGQAIAVVLEKPRYHHLSAVAES